MKGALRTFLLEIGTEEIPARMIPGALVALAGGVRDAVIAAGLQAGAVRPLGTPRRLAFLLDAVPERAPDRETEVTGPPVGAAFDPQGRPTRAAEGFARAQGARVEDLRRVATPRGECVAVRRTIAGRDAAAILAEIAPQVAAALVFPKTMRWGSGEHRFVRPVHWIVALLDDAVVEFSFLGIASGRDTRPHRLRGEAPVPVPRASDYVPLLEAHGVLVDPGARRRRIAAGLLAAAREVGGQVAPPPGAVPGAEGEADPDLLDEVTHLVEWPSVLRGGFDRDLLELPGEILLTSMRHHQKDFAIRGEAGLLNSFLVVANVPADPEGIIRRGNEWVLRARLSDARFFYNEDRRRPLEAFGPALERVAFHERLGSYRAKTARIGRLTTPLLEAFAASHAPAGAEAVRRAASLCKNDLCTQVVSEFPELEGITGGLYARADGLGDAVSEALYDQYLPRSLDDAAPRRPEGAILSLADRLDTQAGMFLVGEVPTGSRDPYGLRRSVQGACRILLERSVRVDLNALLGAALDGYGDPPIADALPRAQAHESLMEFWRARQEHLAVEAGLPADVVRAALEAGASDPSDARLRMQAVSAFRRTPGFDDLAAAHKRIRNILAGQAAGAAFDPAHLREAEERALGQALASARPLVEGAARRQEYGRALEAIARLREPLDRFFKSVMVMSEDRVLRANRLSLLRDLAALFLEVADFGSLAPAVASNPVAPNTRKEE
jgi:glycyl-tRNA synthetase beta chain